MFLNVIMLAGIAGAAVPLVLHLLNRAQYRSIDWGAMMFLRPGDARQRQSTRLRQWLLLAMRMALIALLALALARPILAGRLGALGQPTGATVVILLDHSGSMAVGRPGHTRMDQANEAVRQILATLGHGDQAALLIMGDTARNISAAEPRPTADLQSIADALASPRLHSAGYGVADMADGLRHAADIFDHDPGHDRELFIVCDRQALNWKDVTDDAARGWRARLAMPGPPPRFVVIPVGGWDADSVAIQSMTLDAPQALANQSVDVEVTLRNYGPTPHPAMVVHLLTGDHEIAQTTADLAADASTTVRLPMRLGGAGSRVVTARIDAAGAAGGDRMDLALDVAPPLDVLAFRPPTPPSPDYLRLALMPFASADRNQPDIAALHVAAPEDYDKLDPRKRPVVILEGIPAFTPAQAHALEQYVYGGGGLLVEPGAASDVNNYNAMLYRDGAGILPAALQPAAPSASPTTILGLDLASPVFRFLREKPDPIPTATIGRYFPATPRQPDGHVLASFATGSPFLVEGSFGRGRVALITVPWSESWSTLPVTNFFLPMMQSLVRYLAASPSRNLAPGEPIVAQFTDLQPNDRCTVITPSASRRAARLQPEGDALEIRYADTSEPGIYTVEAPGHSQHFVVLPSRDESDLTPLPRQRWEELSRLLGFTLVELDQGRLADALGDAQSQHEMWAVLLAAVLALGLAELIVERVQSRPVAGVAA